MSLDAPFSVPFVHRLRFTTEALRADNPTLRQLMPAPARALFLVDEPVAESQTTILLSIERYPGLTLAGPTQLVTGGEAVKNNPRNLEPILRAIADAKLCRQSYVVAIGGGAVLDAVGFAAAMAHRGVRLIRLPSTTLAQADSGVGVKNGINAFGRKNYLGVFAPPWAVVNDAALLRTLSDRDWRCGLAEAVKVALVKDAAFFEQLERDVAPLSRRDEATMNRVIRRSAELHLRHITAGGDPFELTAARPLDFGHWAAHRLETLSHHELRHGEAVAIGVALDTRYSVLTRLLDRETSRRVNALLTALGFGLSHPAMHDHEALLQGLEEFREHLGGELTVTMLRGIGQGVDVHEVDHHLMRRAATEVAAP